MELTPEELALDHEARAQSRINKYKDDGTYYWVRWEESGTYGESEIHFPNWYTGSGPRGRTRVAAVMGASANDVMEFIRQSYDTPPVEITFTFVALRQNDDKAWSDRFILSDWMMWPWKPTEASPAPNKETHQPTTSLLPHNTCQKKLITMGRTYAKTCALCGLGPCVNEAE